MHVYGHFRFGNKSLDKIYHEQFSDAGFKIIIQSHVCVMLKRLKIISPICSSSFSFVTKLKKTCF